MDVFAQEQFAKTLLIVRRVKLVPYHVIATYDPLCVYGNGPRRIVLKDFDGRKGLMLVLFPDAQTRIFVVAIP